MVPHGPPQDSGTPIRQKRDIFHTLKLLHLTSIYSLLSQNHQCSEAAGEQTRQRGWSAVSLLLSSEKTLLALFGYHLST